QPLALDSIVSRAVGLEGQPESIWDISPSRARFQMTDCSGNSPKWRDLYGHGWYWRGGRKKPKRAPEDGITSLPTIKIPNGNVGKSAKVVAELLGAVTAREIGTRL